MRIALPALVLFALLGSRIACASDDTVTSVPGGTIVRVVSIQTLSSATSHAGDAFVLYVSEDVTVDGKIVVRKGATGRGHVVGAHNFAQGRQKVIDWTTPLTTFVAETVSVASAQSVP
jgi:hypothetical protein